MPLESLYWRIKRVNWFGVFALQLGSLMFSMGVMARGYYIGDWVTIGFGFIPFVLTLLSIIALVRSLEDEKK